MRILRVYHGGRDAAHRARERALAAAGASVTLVVPSEWPDQVTGIRRHEPTFEIIELEVKRPGNVNRHKYKRESELSVAITRARPDLLDIHEEPFSSAIRQCLHAAPANLPVVMYSAQNIDKRLPPPFFSYERHAYRRAAGLYPCSRQAASVARGKGFSGLIEVIPLGYDASAFRPGNQSLDDGELLLGVFGRLIPEKGICDAVRVLEALHRIRPTRLLLVGDGPEGAKAVHLAEQLGFGAQVEVRSWCSSNELAALYRRIHVLLVPSRATARWAEQFGRVIVEGQASGAVVAGYRSGAIPEVAGSPGIIVREGEIDLFTQRVVEMVTAREEWWARREAGIERSKDRTWESVAAKQVDFYERVLSSVGVATMPRSGVVRRQMARGEFGSTAATPAGSRPFAFPPLRSAGAVAGLLGWGIDLA